MPTSTKLSADLHLDLSTVSSLYAPGNLTAWLLVACSVIVDATSYSLSLLTKRRRSYSRGQGRSRRNVAGNRSSRAYRLLRKIIPLDPNVIGTLTYPLVAAADVLQRRHLFNDGEDVNTSIYSAEAKPPGLDDIAATIAPVMVCRMASVVLPICFILSLVIEKLAEPLLTSPDEIRRAKEKDKNRTLKELFVDHFPIKPYAFFLTTALVNLALVSAPCEDRLNAYIARAAGLAQSEAFEGTPVRGIKFTVKMWIENSANIPRNQQLCSPLLATGTIWIKVAIWVPLFSLVRIYQGLNPQGYLDDHDWRKKRTPISAYLYDAENGNKFKPGALFIMIINWLMLVGTVPCIFYSGYLLFHVFVDLCINFVVMGVGSLTTAGWSNIPTTSAKMSDLDQIVAVVGGACALVYSLFSCLVEYAALRDIKMFLLRSEDDSEDEEEYEEEEKDEKPKFEGDPVGEQRGLLLGERARKRVPTLDMNDARDRTR